MNAFLRGLHDSFLIGVGTAIATQRLVAAGVLLVGAIGAKYLTRRP